MTGIVANSATTVAEVAKLQGWVKNFRPHVLGYGGKTMKHLMFITMLLIISIACYAQESQEYTLFVGDFENKAGIENPILTHLSSSLDHSFPRSELVKIKTISPGLRSAYLRSARLNSPLDADATQLALLAAKYAQANAVLVGSYTKVGRQWQMETQLYVMREGSQAKEEIKLQEASLFVVLDNLAAEVSKRLGTEQYMMLSTLSWVAYKAYRQGHQAFSDFNYFGAIEHFQKAIDLDPHLAVAHAELGLSHIMLQRPEKARSAFANAMKNLQYANESEQLVVRGLESYYNYYWFLRPTSGGYDIPRMREDKVWDEPWLHWYIGLTSDNTEARNRAYERWLQSAIAYAGAGFYGATELVNAGKEKCLWAFNNSADSQFLDAALQFIAQAADLETDDKYDDVWKHWELAKIYDKMNKHGAL